MQDLDYPTVAEHLGCVVGTGSRERWWARNVRAKNVLHYFMGGYPTPLLTISSFRVGTLPAAGCD